MSNECHLLIISAYENLHLLIRPRDLVIGDISCLVLQFSRDAMLRTTNYCSLLILLEFCVRYYFVVVKLARRLYDPKFSFT